MNIYRFDMNIYRFDMNIYRFDMNNFKIIVLFIFFKYIYSRSSVTQHADNSTLPITQHPTNIWLDSYLLHVNKNPITQQI